MKFSKGDIVASRETTFQLSTINGTLPIDFGLVYKTEKKAAQEITSPTETIKNEFLITPEGTIPGGHQRDKRTDITALSAVFYYLLTGHSPKGLSDDKGVIVHRRVGYEITSVDDSVLLDAINSFLDVGLAYRIDDRFQSISEFLERLRMLKGVAASGEETILDDPVALAADIGKHLQGHHRPTQLRNYGQVANRLLDRLAKYIENLGRQMKTNFAISLSRMSNATLSLEGYDKITQNFLSFEIMPVIQTNLRKKILLAIFAKKMEAVVCIQEHTVDIIDKPAAPFGVVDSKLNTNPPFKPIYCYKAEVEPKKDELEKVINRFVSEGLKQLNKEIQ